MGPLRHLRVIALALALHPGAALAQNATASPLFQWGQRPDGVYTFVVEANPVEPFNGAVSLRTERYYPRGETSVRAPVTWAHPGRHVTIVPAPFGPSESVSLHVDGSGLGTAVNLGGNYRPGSGPWTWVAVVGLGQRVAGAFETTQGTSRLLAAAGSDNPATGEPWLPQIPSAYSGAQVVIAGAAAVASAPPESQRALDDWVLGGGVLALSLRGDMDARHPFVRGLVGDDPRALARFDFGGARAHGTGVVVVLEGDLSLENWAADPRTARAIEAFARAIEDGGGGLVPPGDLSLWRRFIEPRGSARTHFRPSNRVGEALGPLALVFSLYIIAVGLILRRNRQSRSPLAVFWKLPALGAAVLAGIYGVTHALRAGKSEARVAVFLDLGSGSSRAMRRVFATLTAGRSTRVDLAPPPGHVALAHTSGSAASGLLQWDGARLSVDHARLSLWETGSVYSEGVVPLGGPVTLTLAEGAARVENRSALPLREGVYIDVDRRAWAVPPLAPGASVTVETTDRARSFSPTASRGDSLSATLFEAITAGPGSAVGCAQYYATAALPADVGAWVSRSRFELARGDALLRVVAMPGLDPREQAGALPRPRLGAYTYGAYNVESVPAVVVEDASTPADVSVDASEEAGP